MNSLNPVMRIRDQITDVIETMMGNSQSDSNESAFGILACGWLPSRVGASIST